MIGEGNGYINGDKGRDGKIHSVLTLNLNRNQIER